MFKKKKVEEKKEEKKVCVKCGHVFEFGGEKRKISGSAYSFSPVFSFFCNDLGEDNSVTQEKRKDVEWYCSLHIPAWDKKKYDTYYKEFPVNEDGTLIKPKKKSKKKK